MKETKISVEIRDWAYESKDKLASVGHSHQEKLTVSKQGLYDLIEQLYQTELNVMLYHTKDDKGIEEKTRIIWVDTRRFSQR